MVIEIKKWSFNVQWQSLVLNNSILQKPGEAKCGFTTRVQSSMDMSFHTGNSTLDCIQFFLSMSCCRTADCHVGKIHSIHVVVQSPTQDHKPCGLNAHCESCKETFPIFYSGQEYAYEKHKWTNIWTLETSFVALHTSGTRGRHFPFLLLQAPLKSTTELAPKLHFMSSFSNALQMNTAL